MTKKSLFVLCFCLATATTFAVTYDCKTQLNPAPGSEGNYKLENGKFSSVVAGDPNRSGTIHLSMGEDASVECLMAEDIIWCLAIQEAKSNDANPRPKRSLMGSLVVDTNTKIFRLTAPKEWESPGRVLHPYKSFAAELECRKNETDN